MPLTDQIKRNFRTPLGFKVCALRNLHGERLFDQAERLGYGTAELSGYEWGRKPWPDDAVKKIVMGYNLLNDPRLISKLENAAAGNHVLDEGKEG